ncbi:serine--tRNA ligase [Fontivita pretiosa]|uniref:serine--tRNA ligase n=1 Tax=Fontivita pretiosa TaxID=2989684 RepID=UPI003D164912
MIDLKDLRENPDKYRKAVELKRMSVDVAAVLDVDARCLAAQQEFERLRAEQNEASKQIGKLKDPAAKQQAIAKVAVLKAQVKEAEERWKSAEAQLLPLLLQMPQPPDPDVPVGKDETENVELRRWGDVRHFEFAPRDHVTLGAELGMIDIERGVKLAGSRSYFLTGMGTLLHQAVLRLAQDMMLERGFVPMTVPVLVREEAMTGTGYFPLGREQAYAITNEDPPVYLVGTAEVSLTAYHMNETLDGKTLPRKYVATSPCFRREAGTYGKDTAGIYRIHQFDKVEQVIICRNDVEESKRWHQAITENAEAVLQKLNLPYRVVYVCTGDLGQGQAAKYDIETWMPSRKAYSETHSASRFYEFQARRLNLRYRDSDGKTRYCHTLNNTVIASPRILIPILENYQNADGSVTIPEALRPYLGGRDRITRQEAADAPAATR